MRASVTILSAEYRVKDIRINVCSEVFNVLAGVYSKPLSRRDRAVFLSARVSTLSKRAQYFT